MARTWSQALFKLVFFVILLPATITYLHVYHANHRAHLLFVGPASASSLRDNSGLKTSESMESSLHDLYGMYHGLSNNNDKKKEPTVFSRAMALPVWHFRWPSIAHVSTILATPTSTLLRRANSMKRQDSPQLSQIVYDSGQEAWCAQTKITASGRYKICSNPTKDEASRSAPPSGIWTDGTRGIQVSYNGEMSLSAQASSLPSVTAAKDSSIPQKFRRNPNKRTRANRNVEQVLLRPTTSLLIAVNVLIAFVYWNRGTSPASVAKVYKKIVQDGEYWRAFTGATAHFDLLHLGFNMMALYSLGTELEPSYGSIPFLFYNLSLIPITTCIMMALVYLQIRASAGNAPAAAALADTSTVGYSGVLFCWMVIASLERTETCPIPFVPDVCFATHTIGNFRFNIGPLVQLGVAQVIMKRVSFVGHLAGIVAGFLLHWNLLPLELVQPEVLIPALYLFLLWRSRRVIPVTSQQEQHADQGGDDSGSMRRVETPPTSSGRFDARRIKRERDQSMHRLLVHVRTALVVDVVVSAITFDVLGGMFIAPVLGLVFYQCCIQSHSLLLSFSSRESTEYEDKKSRLGTLWKGFILSNALTVVCDSMSLSGWMLSIVYWQSDEGTPVGLVPACVVLVFRLAVQMFALVLACKNLADIGETGGGVFVEVFGSTVLENARIAGTSFQSWVTKTNWTAFEGQGVSLGSVNASNDMSASSQVV